jgi:hypothetical protein
MLGSSTGRPCIVGAQTARIAKKRCANGDGSTARTPECCGRRRPSDATAPPAHGTRLGNGNPLAQASARPKSGGRAVVMSFAGDAAVSCHRWFFVLSASSAEAASRGDQTDQNQENCPNVLLWCKKPQFHKNLRWSVLRGKRLYTTFPCRQFVRKRRMCCTSCDLFRPRRKNQSAEDYYDAVLQFGN